MFDTNTCGVEPSPFLSNVEAARYLRLSLRTLEKLRVAGGGPKFLKLGRRVVYAVTDLHEWAGARICSTTSDPQPTKGRVAAKPKAKQV